MVETPIAVEESAPESVSVQEEPPASTVEEPLAAHEVDTVEEGPSDEDMAAYLGASGGNRIENEDEAGPSGGDELPSLSEVENRIPVKTRALMEELFRAKLSKVQRINPKNIR